MTLPILRDFQIYFIFLMQTCLCWNLCGLCFRFFFFFNNAKVCILWIFLHFVTIQYMLQCTLLWLTNKPT